MCILRFISSSIIKSVGLAVSANPTFAQLTENMICPQIEDFTGFGCDLLTPTLLVTELLNQMNARRVPHIYLINVVLVLTRCIQVVNQTPQSFVAIPFSLR